MAGRLYGVGVGPGDPELLTLKAARVIRAADVVVHFARRGSQGNAWVAARVALAESRAEVLAFHFPYTTERSPRDPEYARALGDLYDEAARCIGARLDEGRRVVVLCEGDPLFYGSFMYLHDRLAPTHAVEVVPGVASFVGCLSAAGLAMVSTDRTYTVLPATLPEPALEAKVRQADAFTIIKLGRSLPKVRRVLERAGRLAEATYIERGTTDRQQVRPLAELSGDVAAYFSLVAVPSHSGGPYRALSEYGLS